VAYPVVRLERGVLAHVEAMARAVCEVAAALGVSARFAREPTGVWVGEGSAARKLAAFGVHVRRRVAIHGLALNATVDLAAFDLIVPCGLAGARVTSLEREAGRSPPPAELQRPLGESLCRALGRRPSWIGTGEGAKPLAAVRSALLSESPSVE
jgi:lipoyl(octanoyl) transferase